MENSQNLISPTPVQNKISNTAHQQQREAFQMSASKKMGTPNDGGHGQHQLSFY